MNWALISAVNNEEVVKSCLLNSPGIQSATEVLLQRGFVSAAAGYNEGMDLAKSDLLVFAHQDVYLPEGWIAKVQTAIEVLSRQDPNWAVLGAWGVKRAGERAGHVYCAGTTRVLGCQFEGGEQVGSLDEVLLIMRKSSGLRFDQRLLGFHMYGTDICLEAQRHGLKCYAISAFFVHNTNGYNMLPQHFWRSCWFIRSKWKAELPIRTPCIDITYSCWPMLRWNVIQALNILLKRHKPGRRVANPKVLYDEMVKGDIIERPTST